MSGCKNLLCDQKFWLRTIFFSYWSPSQTSSAAHRPSSSFLPPGGASSASSSSGSWTGLPAKGACSLGVGVFCVHIRPLAACVCGGVGVQRTTRRYIAKVICTSKAMLHLKGITGQRQRRNSWIGMVFLMYSTRSGSMTSSPPGHPAGRTLLDPDQPLRLNDRV